MAAVAVLFGGMLGFFAALVGYFALGFSGLEALALWSGTGIAFTALAVLLSFQPSRAEAALEAA